MLIEPRSLRNAMPYVLSCPTCSRASRASYLSARVSRVLRTLLVPHMSYALRFPVPLVPRVVRALLLLISHLLQVLQA